MSLDSDSDLQAYINELSKKTQDWQYEDEESAVEAIATPSINSSVDIVIDKKEVEKSDPAVKQNSKSNIIRELEAKYLKRDPRSIIQDISFSLSENDLKSEKEDASSSVESHKSSNQEKKIAAVNPVATENRNEIQKKFNRLSSQTQDQTSFQEDKHEFSRTPSREEESRGKSFFHATRHQRKLSDSSLLLNKSGIFYSSSISTDKPSNISYQSGSSDSISEEIPELENDEIPKPRKIEKLSRQESVLYSVKESPEPSQRNDDEISARYEEEDTFESTEETSDINDKNVESDQESLHESSVSSDSEDEKTVKSSKDEKTVESSEKTRVDDVSYKSNELVTRVSHESSNSATRITHESSKSAVQLSENSNKSVTSMSHESSKSVTLMSHESSKSVNELSHESSKKKNSEQEEMTDESSIIQDEPKTKSKKHLERKEKIHRRKSDTTRRAKSKPSSQRRKKPPASPSSVSSTDSSSESDSESSSFYVRMKRKKYKEKKRKLKHEKEMTELIIKTLVKNLPLILRHTMGINLAPTAEPKPRYVCRNCGGNPTGWEATNSRIDDALRQTVDLTRQFLDAHKTLLQTEYHIRKADFKYTRLKNYSLS